MIGDVASILSLLNDLVTRKSSINREYFEDFIEPVWLVFTQIHEDYKESLPKYRNSLLKGEDPVEILHQINFDSCLNEDLRVKLTESIRSIPSKKLIAKEKAVYDFAAQIIDYFDLGYQASQVNPKETKETQKTRSNQLTKTTFDQRFNKVDYMYNIARIDIFDSIAGQLKSSETDNHQKVYQEALLTTQNTLGRIQDCYRRVAESYFLVRQELLK